MSAQSYVQGAVLAWAANRATAAAGVGQATVVSRVWFNDANTSTWFFVPGILMMVLTISGVFLTAMVMAREWERGTFESMLYLVIALSLGLVISSLTKNQLLACQMSLIISFLPTVMLSGFMFDLHSEPLIIRIVSHFLPMTYFLELMKSLLLAGNYWSLIARDTAILVGYAVFFMCIAYRLTRKKVEG